MQKRHIDNKLYFEEQVYTTRKYMIPYLDRFCQLDADCTVLEIGCGIGGNLLPFLERGCEVVGIDSNKNKLTIAQSQLQTSGFKAMLLYGDALKCIPPNKFDIIILKDTIEHLYSKTELMMKVKSHLNHTGFVLVWFPPWQMPFGGHQQILQHKVLSKTPFLHLLPQSKLLWLWQRTGEDSAVIKELMHIRKCRFSIEDARKIWKQVRLEIVFEQMYFISPAYEKKFGLRPFRLPKLLSHIPIIRNFVSSCYITILQYG